MNNKAYLGVDIGGTSVRGKMINDSGETLASFTFPTDRDYDTTLLRFSQELPRGDFEIASIGIGVALSVTDGVLGGGGKLMSWAGRTLEEDLRNMFNIPVSVVNDTKAATLGESTVRDEDFMFVIWGTGVGCSVSRYNFGKASVQATELGHMVIDIHSDKPCGCGGYGHLESHIGGGYLQDRFGIEPKAMSDEQWSEVLKELAYGIYNIALGRQGLSIVFGGGVAFKQLGQVGRLEELQGYVNELTANGLTTAPALSLAHYGEDSGLAGAVHLAREIASSQGD